MNKINVFVVTSGADYEDESIRGIYDTMEKAITRAHGLNSERGTHIITDDSEDYKEWRSQSYIGKKYGIDFVRIVTHEVQ